jgi:hypothetical protein
MCILGGSFYLLLEIPLDVYITESSTSCWEDTGVTFLYLLPFYKECCCKSPMNLGEDFLGLTWEAERGFLLTPLPTQWCQTFLKGLPPECSQQQHLCVRLSALTVLNFCPCRSVNVTKMCSSLNPNEVERLSLCLMTTQLSLSVKFLPVAYCLCFFFFFVIDL